MWNNRFSEVDLEEAIALEELRDFHPDGWPPAIGRVNRGYKKFSFVTHKICHLCGGRVTDDVPGRTCKSCLNKLTIQVSKERPLYGGTRK